MSLGWISESTFLPRKKEQIAGVSSSSLVTLKSAIYEQKSSGSTPSVASSKKYEVSSSSGKNRGIEDRIQRDMIAMRHDTQADNSEKLQQKALLYEKLMKGEMSDSHGSFLVDFQAKQLEEESSENSDEFIGGNVAGSSRMMSTDMRREQERQEWLSNMAKEDADSSSRSDRQQLVTEVASRTLEARQRVDAVRKQRKMMLARRVAKIKSRQQDLQQQQLQQASEADAAHSRAMFQLPNDDGAEQPEEHWEDE